MTQDEARELFNYDPGTGALTWAVSRTSKVRVGQEAGGIYRHATRGGKAHRRLWIKGHGRPMVHCVIWVWMTGHWPVKPEQVDHKDGDGLNNKWKNLRLVSGASEQAKNQRLPGHNTTGAIGVCFNKSAGKYQAYIKIHGKSHHLGMFARLEDAIAARVAASEKYGFHPNHGQERPL